MEVNPTRLLSGSKIVASVDLPMESSSKMSKSVVQRLEKEAVPLERQREYRTNM